MAKYGDTRIPDEVVWQNAPKPETSEFAKGLKAGFYSAASQLGATGGQAAEAAGFNNVAGGLYDWSRGMQGEAQAPELRARVSDFRDAPKSLSNLWDYGTYMLGASAVPSAAGVVGGLLTKNPYVGATIATAPFTIGEQVQRIAADPVASQLPVGERAANAAVTGLGSAFMGSVVPGMVAGQLAGRTAGNTLRGAAMRNAIDIPLEGATEAAQTAIHQRGVGVLNPGRDATGDTEELKQSFFGGMAAGAPLAAIGTAADVAGGRGRNTQPRPELGELAGGARVNPRVGAGAAGGAEEGRDMGSVTDDLSRAATAAYGRFRGVLSDTDFAGMVPEALRPYADKVVEQMRGPIKDTVALAQRTYESLREEGALPPDITKEWGDKANQAKIFMAGELLAARRAMSNTARDVGDQFRGLFGMRNPDDDVIDIMASGREPLTPEQAAGMTPPQIEMALRQADQQYAGKAAKWATDLLGDDLISDEMKARIQAAAQNLDDKANRTFIAAQVQAQRLRQRIDDALASGRFDRTQGARPGDEDAIDVGGTVKRSLVQARDEFPEIVSGLETVLRDRVVPTMQARFPNQLDDPQMINKVGNLLRAAVESSLRGEQMNRKQRETLRDMLGESQTAGVLNDIYQTSGLARGDADRAERFYASLNALNEMEMRDARINDIISKNLVAEAQGQMRATQIPALANTLTKVLNGDYERNLSPAQRQFYRSQVKQDLVRAFGDKAGTVVQELGVALGKARRGQKLVQDMWSADAAPEESMYDSADAASGGDEEAIGGSLGKPEERSTDNRYYGTSGDAWRMADLKDKGRAVKFMDSEADARAMYPGTEPLITKRRRELEEMLAEEHKALGRSGESPSKRIEEITGRQFAEETGANVDEKDYGRRLLVVRDLPSNDIAMKPHEFEALKADTRYKDSPTRFKFGEGENDFLDAKRVLDYGRSRMKSQSADIASSGPVRDAEAFAYGLAAVSEHLGRSVEPAPNTVIFKTGGTPVTYSQLRGLMTQAGRATGSSGRADRMDERQTAQQIEQERWHLEQTLERLELIDQGGAGDALRSLNERVKTLEKSSNEMERTAALTLKADMKALMQLAKMKGDRRADMIDYLSNRITNLRGQEERQRVAESVEDETSMTGERGRTAIPLDEEIHLAAAVNREDDGNSMARSVDAAGLPLKANQKPSERAFSTRTVGKGPDASTEVTGITNTGRAVLDSRGQKLEQSVSLKHKNLGTAIRWLATQDLTAADAVLLNADTMEKVPDAQRRGTVLGLYKKYATQAQERGEPTASFGREVVDPVLREFVDRPLPTQPIDAAATKAAGDERRSGMGREPHLMRSYDVPPLITDEQLSGLSENALKTLQKMMVDTSDGRIAADRAPELSATERTRVEQMLRQIRTETAAADIGRTRMNNREAQVAADARYDQQRAQRLADLDAHIEQQLAKMREARSGGTSPEAKKNALLERIRSGDPTLAQQIAESTDAKGLQRALDYLNGLKGNKKDERVLAAIDAMNARMAALVQNPDIAYAMMLGQYKLDSRLADIARVGVAVTSHVEIAEAFGAANLELTVLGNLGASKDEIAKGLRPYTEKLTTIALTGNNEETLAAVQAMRVLGEAVNDTIASQVEGKGNAVNTSVLEGMKAGEKLGDLMTRIADASTDEFDKVVARAVRKVARDVEVKLVDLGRRDEFGMYYADDRRVEIATRVQDTASKTLLHEGVHAATLDAVYRDPNLHKAFFDLMNHVAEYDPAFSASYGGSKVVEFIAEGLSNARLRERMRDIPSNSSVAQYLGQTVANAWDTFVKLVRNALGLSPKHDSALTQFLELSGRAMKDVGTNPNKLTVDDDLATELMERQMIAPDEMRAAISQLHDALQGLRGALADDVIDAGIKMLKQRENGLVANGQYNDFMGVLTLKFALLNKKSMTDDAPSAEMMEAAIKNVSSLAQMSGHTLASRASEQFDAAGTAFSQQAGGGRPPLTAQERRELKAYIDKVLGGKIKTHFANMPYAGEFHAAAGTTGAIVLSKTSLDPLGAAHHEALHGFIHQLKATGASDMVNELLKAASSGHVQKQLRDLLAGETAALGQLSDPEERAAYMFQFYTAGKLTLNDKSARGIIKRITDWIKGVLGLWTAEQNAQRIMDYFESGEYGQNIGNRSALAAVMEGPKKNAGLRALRDAYHVISDLSASVASMGSARLRDTNVPELQQLADLVKRDRASPGQDAGFIPASRMERNERLNQFGALLKGLTQDQIQDGMEALQRGDRTSAVTPEGRMLAFGVQKLLRELHTYMREAGVNIGDLGKNYFPRVWDPAAISKDVEGFKKMLEKYVRSGDLKAGSVDVIVARLMTGNGTDLQIETDRPGMVFANARNLSFISGADAQQWLQTNLMATMNSYISQATRRAEWARRFGDANERLEGVKDATGTVIKDGLYQKALKAGATMEQIDVARDFMRGVNGTLGDHIDPRLRRLMGNMIVYQNIRLLPLAIFSSVVDPIGVVVNGGTVGDAWKTFVRGIKEIPSGFRDNPSRDASYEMAELIGTIDNAMLTHTLGALYGQGVMGETAQRINDSFFKYNLMEQFNRSMRVGATEAAMNFLAKHADGTASKHSERWLAELGLKPGEVKLDANGRPLLWAQDFERLGMSKDDAEKQAARIRIAVNQWVDGAVLRPDAADRPIWMNDPRYMLISHLKQFVYSFQSTILDRVIHEFDHGNYRPAMALASYVPVMIASDLAKGMLQGGGELPEYKKSWGAGDWVWSGVQRAGILGVTQTGLEGMGGIAGPTVEQMLDAVKVAGGREQFGQFAIEAMPANALFKFNEDAGSR